jgi:hypothetical protein
MKIAGSQFTEEGNWPSAAVSERATGEFVGEHEWR